MGAIRSNRACVAGAELHALFGTATGKGADRDRATRGRGSPAAPGQRSTSTLCPAMALPQHLALFLTWRTYGTWLPGDERGWIDERRNGFGEPMNVPDMRLEGAARGQMRSAPMKFTDPQRLAVDLAIREACEFRGWQVVALNVRTNHVHLVVGTDEQPSKVLNVLKGRTTTVLRTGRTVVEHRPIWARGGSRRVLWDDAAMAAAVEYVLNAQ